MSGPAWRWAPEGLSTEQFVLEPLGPHHNGADHAAWISSIEHIRATPGFTPEHWGGDAWPYPMSLGDNLADLQQHADELTADDDAARCRMWVRADRAHLDGELAAGVRAWLTGPAWNLTSVRFPGRD